MALNKLSLVNVFGVPCWGVEKKTEKRKKENKLGLRLVGTNREIRFGFGALRGWSSGALALWKRIV